MDQISPIRGYFRRLTSADRDRFEAHLLRLDPESRRNRFGGAVSETFLRDYSANAFAAKGAIFGYFEEGELRAAAELRALITEGDGEAEAAFSVEPEWRRRGVGSALFRRVIDAARNRNVRRILVICLPDNRGMQALTQKFDGDIERLTPETLAVVRAPRADIFSRWREAADNAIGFAAAVFDTQQGVADLSSASPRRKPAPERPDVSATM